MTKTASRTSNHEVTFSEYFPYVHHAASVPVDLAQGVERRRHRVVIAGGGPTGLAMALGLANHGVPCTVIESDDTICSGSRAGAFTRRTLEILERLGIAEAVVANGYGWDKGWVYHRDAEIARTVIPTDDDQKYPATLSQLQNFIEQCMVDECARRDGLVDLRWQTSVQGVHAARDGVRVLLSTPDSGYAVDADWLVACDGARSIVRSSLGLRMHGKRHAGRYVIIDVRIDTTDMPIGRRWWFDPPSNPGGTLIMFRKPGGMLRFDYQLRDDEDADEAMQTDRVLARVGSHLKMLGIDRPWEPVWMSLYRASAMTLESYRHGRVLFAGDAAHLVPIFGVRGMNSAIEDAHNLAWKLAFVVRGIGPDSLLDTYSDERVHAARENLRFASRGAEFMSPPSVPHRLMRDAVLSLSHRHPWIVSLMNPRQHAAHALDPSRLCLRDAAGGFDAGPAPGMVLSECPVRIHEGSAVRDGHLTSLLGPQFTLLWFAADGTVPAAIAQAVVELSRRVPLALRELRAASGGTDDSAPALSRGPVGVDHTGRLYPMYGARLGSAYLVRPDGHVMARWQDPSARTIKTAIARALEA